MLEDRPWALCVAGILCGLVLGWVARRHRFCTLSALERHWYAGDSNGLRTWVLAIAVAIATTQLSIASGYLDISDNFYLNGSLSIPSIVIGGLMFGVGMALVGTCGYGALVQIGGGSLRALMVVLIMSIAALATQRGILSITRQNLSELTAVSPETVGTKHTGYWLHSLIDGTTSATVVTAITTLAVVGLLLVWVFRSLHYRNNPAQVRAGIIVGLCISAGWWITASFQSVLFEPVALESASFVMPPGEWLLSVVGARTSMLDYGMGLVIGVIAGSMITALVSRDIRWEACDDARELGRHIIGGAMMGAGGVLAQGCTIGQGVSAASVLSVTAPLAFFSMMAGAKIGLSLLIEGAPWHRRSRSHPG